MKKIANYNFKINSKSSSLSKINPYYENKEHYLPYKYKDPSFKTQYNGLLLQKDYLILNLMKNRLKKVISYKKMSKKDLPTIYNSPIEISKKTDLVFNSAELEKKKFVKQYAKFIFSKIENKFFNFNPVLSRNDMINYRKNKNKGYNTYRQPMKHNPKTFIADFKRQINQRNYQNWEKIKQEYEQRELSEPKRVDKYHDNNKVWEVLNENKKNYLQSINTDYSDEDLINNIKDKSLHLPSNHRVNFVNNKLKKLNRDIVTIKVRKHIDKDLI